MGLPPCLAERKQTDTAPSRQDTQALRQRQMSGEKQWIIMSYDSGFTRLSALTIGLGMTSNAWQTKSGQQTSQEIGSGALSLC